VQRAISFYPIKQLLNVLNAFGANQYNFGWYKLFLIKVRIKLGLLVLEDCVLLLDHSVLASRGRLKQSFEL
jgi:hypothetical protein